MATPSIESSRVYVGTYTQTAPNVRGKSEGIYVYRMDPASGALTPIDVTSGVVNPSYLVLDPTRRYLYSVNEVQELDGQPTGGVSAFSVDATTGRVTFLNRQLSHGTDPCHVSVDHTGRYLLVANYSSGSAAILPILADGKLAPASDVVQHRGSSVDPNRQQGPHAHSINVDAANRIAVVADLGLDKLMVYRLDREHGKLVPNDPPSTQIHPGAGPRHFAFHPNGCFAYAVNELESSMTALTYDAAAGRFDVIHTLSTLPPGFSGENSCADIHVSPDGRFVYGSNRGHDSIAIFAIAAATGRLTRVGNESTGGRTPRNFAIDPSGTFLLAANQDTDTIVTFRIDRASGKLAPTGHVVEVPMPVCVQIVPIGAQ